MLAQAGRVGTRVGEATYLLRHLHEQDRQLSDLSGSGLASGWGLDELLMLRKGIDDIRLLPASDPPSAIQMRVLNPHEPVSAMPPGAPGSLDRGR